MRKLSNFLFITSIFFRNNREFLTQNHQELLETQLVNIMKPLILKDDGVSLVTEDEKEDEESVLKILSSKRCVNGSEHQKLWSSQLTMYDMGGHTEYYNSQRVSLSIFYSLKNLWTLLTLIDDDRLVQGSSKAKNL